MGGFNSRQFQEMMQQAQKQAQEIQQKMQQTIVEASAGGGTVTVKMNGQKQVLETRIDPAAVTAGDVEMLQDLVTDCSGMPNLASTNPNAINANPVRIHAKNCSHARYTVKRH